MPDQDALLSEAFGVYAKSLNTRPPTRASVRASLRKIGRTAKELDALLASLPEGAQGEKTRRIALDAINAAPFEAGSMRAALRQLADITSKARFDLPQRHGGAPRSEALSILLGAIDGTYPKGKRGPAGMSWDGSRPCGPFVEYVQWCFEHYGKRPESKVPTPTPHQIRYAFNKWKRSCPARSIIDIHSRRE